MTQLTARILVVVISIITAVFCSFNTLVLGNLLGTPGTILGIILAWPIGYVVGTWVSPLWYWYDDRSLRD